MSEKDGTMVQTSPVEYPNVLEYAKSSDQSEIYDSWIARTEFEGVMQEGAVSK